MMQLPLRWGTEDMGWLVVEEALALNAVLPKIFQEKCIYVLLV